MANFSETSVKGFAADVAHIRGTAVKLDTGKVVVATAATDDILGVIDTPNDAGYTASVRLRSASGTAIGLAGATVAIGDRLTSGADGKLAVTTTAGDEVVGIALEAAVLDDEFEFMPSTAQHS